MCGGGKEELSKSSPLLYSERHGELRQETLKGICKVRDKISLVSRPTLLIITNIIINDYREY